MNKPPSKKGKAFVLPAFPWLEQTKKQIASIGRMFCIALLVWLLSPHVGQPMEAEEPKPAQVTINDAGYIYESSTFRHTVREVLAELQINLDPQDTISPCLDCSVTDFAQINISRFRAVKEDLPSGTASWYAHGLPRPMALTAASRQYPRGTRLQVRCLETGKSVDVVINDYGPEAWTGRVIDLSLGAFQAIQNPKLGLTQVEIRPL